MYNCVLYPDAIAYLEGGTAAPLLTGEAKFYQKKEGVLLTITVSGLPRKDGFFGLHIHEGRDCSGDDFSDTLGHFDPREAAHPEHAGDLPPLLSSGGRAYLGVLSDRFRVQDVIGRTIVIHSDADDFHSQPAGNAGMKIACGVIRGA